MRPQRTISPLAVVALLAVVLVAGCGTPQAVSVHNVGNATTGPAQTAPVVQAATQAGGPSATAMPGMEGMGMTTPTTASGATAGAPGAATGQAAPQTAAATSASAGARPTDFVLIWVLFGTPTPKSAQPSAGGAQPTTAVTTAATGASTGGTTTQPTAQTTASTTVATPAPTSAGSTGANTASETSSGDPARGKIVFNGVGTCTSCHDVSAGIKIVGPSLKGVATRAGTRKPGLSAEAYLRESIKTPNAFVVPGFQPGLMPQNFAQILSTQQINDLIAYLMTLK